MGLAYTTAHVFRPEFPPAMRASTTRTLTACLAVCLGIAGAGCTTSSRDVRPLLSNPRDFSGWDCERLDAEAGGNTPRALMRAGGTSIATEARYLDDPDYEPVSAGWLDERVR